MKEGSPAGRAYPVGPCSEVALWRAAPCAVPRALRRHLVWVHLLLLCFQVSENLKTCGGGELLLRAVGGNFRGCEVEHLLSCS